MLINNKHQRLKRVLERCTRLIVTNTGNDVIDYGLLGGITGVGIFYGTLLKCIHNDNIESQLYRITNVISKQLSHCSLDSLCNGIAGMSWGLRLLHELGWIDSDDIDNSLSVVDKASFFLFNYRMARNEIDYLHGGLGLAHYLIYFDIHLEETCATLCDKLGKTVSPNGLWMTDTYIRPFDCRKVYNFGMAHGMASLISVLAKAYEKTNNLKCKNLLISVCDYYVYLYYSRVHDNKPSCFPAWISSDFINCPDSKLAWCYGDLGICFSLFRAASALKNPELSNVALQTALYSTKRLSCEREWCFCHGAAGLLFMYNYLYHKTGEDAFGKASDYWADYLLSLDSYFETTNIGILQGMSGIGLTLLYYLFGIDTKWQHVLLIDL